MRQKAFGSDSTGSLASSFAESQHASVVLEGIVSATNFESFI